MENMVNNNITRTGDYLIIPVSMTLEEINSYRYTPKILKKAIGLYENLEVSLVEALIIEPYLIPVFVLADGMMEHSKGNWSIKLDYGVDIKVGSDIRIDLYGLESYYYETRKGDDGEKWILAGVATIQNANVPELRVVLGRSGGVIFRNKKLEGLIQGENIQDAKSKKKEVLEAYGEEGQDWMPLLETFLKKSGL